MRRKIITLTSILVLVILTATVLIALDINPFEKKQKKTEENYFTKTIDIVAAEKGDLKNTISVKGTLNSEKSIEIKMPVNAVVGEVCVKAGARVEEGDTLAVLDTDSLKSEYDKTYDEWVKAKSELGYMKPSYDYVRIIATTKGTVTENNLVKNKYTEDIINEKEYLLVIKTEDENLIFSNDVPNGKITTVNYLSAKGRQVKSGDLLFTVKVENSGFNAQVEKVEDLEERLNTLEMLLSNPNITVLYDAIISKVDAVEGGRLDKDALILNTNPTDEILVKLTVTKEELRKVSMDQAAQVTLDSGIELSGTVAHISYKPNDNGKFELIVKLSDLSSADVNDILPGLKANVEIVLEEKNDVVKVPVDAIKTDNKGEYVLVYTGGAEDVNNYTVDTIPTEKRYIEKGLVTPLYVEIESGISAGEKVIVVTVSKNENEFYSEMIGF